MLARLCEACGAQNDSQLADFLGIKRQGVLRARKSEAVPPNWLITVSEKTGTSIDWLYYGIGSPLYPYFPENAAYTDDILGDIYFRIIFKNRIYSAQCYEEMDILHFVLQLYHFFDTIIEVVVAGDDFTYSYYLFGSIEDEYDYFFFIDKHFDHGNKDDIEAINKVNLFFKFIEFPIKKITTNNSRTGTMLKLLCQTQDMESMREFFLQGKIESPQEGVEQRIPTKRLLEGQLEREIDYAVKTLKDLGANNEVIQQAVVKLIERGK